MSKSESLAKRRVPCLIAYLAPFRMVAAAELSHWQPTIDDINRRTWDYVALHEMAGGIRVGLEEPYHLVVGRDGSLGLPALPQFGGDVGAVEFFNRCLSALLLGGVYCEAITPDGLDLGSIIDWKYIRSHRTGQAASNRFHHLIRHRQASAYEAIALLEPPTVQLDDLSRAMAAGLAILDRINPLRGEYLLRGVTGIARRDWGSALSNLWIVVEQLISELWDREIVKPTLATDNTKSRKSQLTDTRTWTASARIEMLFQKCVIGPSAVELLGTARKARNELSHNGVLPSEESAAAAYAGVCELLRVALGGDEAPLFDLDISNHAISDPFAPPRPLRGEPTYWMEIPKLPGEAELEKAEAEEASLRREV